MILNPPVLLSSLVCGRREKRKGRQGGGVAEGGRGEVSVGPKAKQSKTPCLFLFAQAGTGKG